MNDQQLLRYSRQIMLPGIDIQGQQALLDSHVLVIGLGGLGSPVALYLAAAGVGTLSIADHDHVELSNLQRQIAHTTASCGQPKTASATQRIEALNPETVVHGIHQRLEGEALQKAVVMADIVVDGSDNFATRFAVNQACVTSQTPLVSAAIIRTEGQVCVFDSREAESPCYRCLYDEQGEDETRCATTGVLAPVAGLLGCIQATEAVKLITGLGQPLTGRLLLVDASTMRFREMKVSKDPACPVCSKKP